MNEQQVSPAIPNGNSFRAGKKSSPGKDSLKSAQSLGTASQNSHLSSRHTNESLNVDNFVPNFEDDGSVGGIDNFLESESAQTANINNDTKTDQNTYEGCDDSSDDEKGGRSNPMVAKIMDDDSEIEIDEVVKIASSPFNDTKSNTKPLNVSIQNETPTSSSEEEIINVLQRSNKLESTLQIPNSSVNKFSDTSISSNSEKSVSSPKSKRNNETFSESKEHNLDNNSDFVFDLKRLPLSNKEDSDNSENVKNQDDKHKTHRKKHKKEKKDKKSSEGGKKNKKVKEERQRDELEEFLTGTITNREAGIVSEGALGFAVPENYEEL